jgi:hypothetical protein
LDEDNDDDDDGDDPELAVRWIGVSWNACDDDDSMITIMMIIIRHKRHDETVMVTVLLFPDFVVFPLLNMIIMTIRFVSERLSGCLDNVFLLQITAISQ